MKQNNTANKMEKSSYNSKRIFKDTHEEISNIVSLTITNDGDSDLVLMVNGQKWDVPKKDIDNKTQSYFEIQPDFTFSDYNFDFIFEGGAGNAVMAYKALLNPKC